MDNGNGFTQMNLRKTLLTQKNLRTNALRFFIDCLIELSAYI